jgi:radical SAM protein with 4Fe4S-binding SPASM domain
MAQIKSKLVLNNRQDLSQVLPIKTPYSFYLDPASACNFRCSFCPTGHKDLIASSNYDRSLMKWSVFERFVDQLKDFDSPLKALRLNKIGEPMLNKNLAKMIRLSKQEARVEWVDFATNGYLFNQRDIYEIVESGVDRINISLEGLSTEDYEKNAKVKINYVEFKKGLKQLYNAKCEQRELRGTSPEILIKIPKELLANEDDEKRFFEEYSDLSDLIFVENLANIWPEFDLDERTKWIPNDKTTQYGLPIKEKLVCTVIMYSLTVNADGSVSACCSDWNQKLILGNIQEENLQDIWLGAEHLKLIRKHLTGQRKSTNTCKDCGHVASAQIDDVDSHRADLATKFEQLMP